MRIFDYAGDSMCWVFEIPQEMSRDFCFGVGHPTTFRMVDWMQAIPPGAEYDEGRLRDFLAKKNYVIAGRHYLVLTNFGESFIFTKEGQRDAN